MDESQLVQVTVCVVVPTYNERENVPRLVDAIKAARVPSLTLFFVDDSSPDGTGGVIREIGVGETWVKLMVRKSKAGIGSAYQEGFREAIARFSPTMVVEMDADLQHPPSSIPDLLKAVEDGADVAVGSRYVKGGGVQGWTLWRRTVSKGANFYARTLLGLPVKDATSGFRAYTKEAASIVAEGKLPGKGFEFQVASLRLLKTRMKIVEVPYYFSVRTSGTSKLGTKDMAKFFVAVLRAAFS